MIEPGEARCQGLLHDLVAIEIDEPDPPFSEFYSQSSLLKHELSVALMSRPFGHDDAFGAERKERSGRSTNQPGICVHLCTWDGLHQVRLQQNGPSTEIQIEQLNTFEQRTVEGSGVGRFIQNRNAGSWFAAIRNLPGRAHSLDGQRSGASEKATPKDPSVHGRAHPFIAKGLSVGPTPSASAASASVDVS
jgi:hypothetical protein